ncbi:MAG: YciK family oxidoreductase [Gammaproteobacteria bacterium]|nr:YciK family oxidoreductase [Gammaproteobacteria bacterium]MDE2250686.1 YciK family oxidoreductase [Gammaproteobacteria bacterium]
MNDAGIRNYSPPAGLLRGRVIAITGAGDGIGRVLALACARLGAQLVLIGRNIKRLESLHAEIGATRAPDAPAPDASIAPLDLEQALAPDYERLAAAVQERYGRLDGLVHNAAILGTLAPVEHVDMLSWVRVLHVNLTAAFALTKVLLPALRASADASLVFTTSSVGRRGRAHWAAYAVSKFGIEGLSQVLADELAGNSRVRVNAVNPGPTRTRMRRQAFPGEDPAQPTDPALVLGTYLWLLGPDSRDVTGRSLDCQEPRPVHPPAGPGSAAR